MAVIDVLAGGPSVVIEDGDWILYRAKEHKEITTKLYCCDCGLFHDLVIRETPEGFKIRFTRNDELTKKLRGEACELRATRIDEIEPRWTPLPAPPEDAQ